ncbi:hypothetical protein Q8A73_019276 [Channa argus]|nr:hypothetical protein Q8A73_019276 [Channa argus]
MKPRDGGGGLGHSREGGTPFFHFSSAVFSHVNPPSFCRPATQLTASREGLPRETEKWEREGASPTRENQHTSNPLFGLSSMSRLWDTPQIPLKTVESSLAPATLRAVTGQFPDSSVMSSNIKVSLENPYGQVTIPRAKLHSSNDVSTVIANPMALNESNPYATSGSAPPPPYIVKEDGGGVEEEGGRCHACCYRCRKRK